MKHIIPDTHTKRRVITCYDDLPDKPSDLIDLALDDVRRVEKTPGYAVYMGSYHVMHRDGICYVCLGGAVLTNYTDRETELDEIPDKITALDLFRRGHISAALDWMGVARPAGVTDVDIASYCRCRDRFHSDLRALASTLRAHGI